MDNLFIQYLEDIPAVEVRVIGSFPTDDEQIEFFYQSVSEALKEHSCYNILLDYRKLEYDQSPLQIVRATQRMKKYQINTDETSAAFVLDTSSKTYDRFRLFLADVDAKNFFTDFRLNYRVFQDYDEAAKWLKLK